MYTDRFTVASSLRAALVCCLALAASAAHAYSVRIDVRAQSWGRANDESTTYPVTGYDFQSAPNTSNLPQPMTVSRDPSTSFGPTAGIYMSALGNYEATVAPGGIHVVSRSVAALDSQAMSAGHGAAIFINGAVESSFADDLRITLAGVPNGTPFLMQALVRVDGTIGTTSSGGNYWFGTGAAANAGGYWGFDLIYPFGRPSGVPTSITNQFLDGGAYLLGIDQAGTLYDAFTQYGMLGAKLVTFYGVSGMQATFDMFLNVGSTASAGVAANNGLPIPAVSEEAGVHLALDRTLAWGGLLGVQLLDGTPVALSDVTVQSSSGFDYRYAYEPAVPEPASALPLAVGGVALAWRRGRRDFAG